MFSKVSYSQILSAPSKLPSDKKKIGKPGLEHPQNRAQKKLSLTSTLHIGLGETDHSTGATHANDGAIIDPER